MPHPKVIKLAPKERRGKIFTEERSNTVTAGVEIPLSPSGTKVHVDHELARKVNREYELRLSGWKRSSETATDNVVVWDCDEARTASRGVVRRYRGAVIVQHPEHQRFRAEFKLNAERGTFNFDSKVFDWFNVFGKKQTDDPVIFDPAEPIGQQYPNLPNYKDLNLTTTSNLNRFRVCHRGILEETEGLGSYFRGLVHSFFIRAKLFGVTGYLGLLAVISLL